MTDIVEQLRQASLNQNDYRWEAADEIERLRAENERLRKALLVAAYNLEYWGGYVDSDIAIAALEGKND